MTQVRPIEQLFGELIDLESPEQRRQYLDQACGDDEVLREQLEKLLTAHVQAGSFLRNAEDVAPTIAPPTSEHEGAVIGPYKLRERLGEGGMGEVWAAEQKQPLRRKVALKLIKPGMDTSQVIARFEAEREALALMDHPNIARVLDAGTTDAGRPYFVMELIHGIPVADYCDTHKLAVRQRLELFIQVCKAVQHAHQKGIIHRDIKPSNVLVTEQDGKPVPKVIDFGVAKALHQPLTERSIYTGVFQVIGTLAYMSPEQAALSPKDVDTRTDVYGLGVLLYELLTGTTPFDREQLERGALDEALRIIREQDALRPSTRLSTLGARLTSISQGRGTDPNGLGKLVSGDLDWIVMKALEKNRSRRYETANAFAADVNRYLNGEPIDARPPSTAYRLRKVASRHKASLIAAAMVAVAMMAGTVVSTWLAVRATRAEQSERQLRLVAESETMKADAETRKARIAEEHLRRALAELWEELADRATDAAFSGDFQRAEDAISRAELANAPEGLLQTLRGLALFFDGRTKEALERLEDAAADDPENLAALSAMWWAYSHSSQPAKTTVVRQQLADHRLDPATPYDKLFNALVDVYSATPKESVIARLDELVGERSRWAVAHAIRATAWQRYGEESKNLDHFRRAIKDFDESDRLLPHSPFVLTTGMAVLVSAIELAQCKGSDADAKEWRDRADKIASDFDNWPGHLWGRTERAAYYTLTGQLDKAAREEADLILRGVGSGVPMTVKRFLEGDSDRLQRELQLGGNDINLRVRLALLLAANSNDGRRKAMAMFNELQNGDVPDVEKELALDIPLLVGEYDVARVAAWRLLRSSRISDDWKWCTFGANHISGALTEAEFIEEAGPFSGQRCVVHYTIAMMAIAVGDRPKARKHFEEAVGTGRVSWWDYHWSQAFLERMKGDPEWPKWIPLQGSE